MKQLPQPKQKWNLDTLLMKTVLGKRFPHEYESKVELPDPLITRKIHLPEGYAAPYTDKGTVTLFIPPWAFDERLHALPIEYAQTKGPVVEFLWDKKAISPDVESTARAYEIMSSYVAKSLEQITALKEKYAINEIHIASCSAGIPILTGALNKLYAAHKDSIFDQITDVTLIGMADNFADCYRYGIRTAHMGALAEKNGYSIDLLREKFSHMAPITAIPALNHTKGKVTWITSYADTHFPYANQKKVIDTIAQTGSKIETKNIPLLGHVGISAVYYTTGTAAAPTKSAGSALCIMSTIYTAQKAGMLEQDALTFMEKCSTGGLTDFDWDVPDEWLDNYQKCPLQYAKSA